MINKVLKIVSLIVLLLTLLTYVYYFIVNYENWVPEIDFLDVGQGDASLIKLPHHKAIVIDGGPDNLVIRRLGEELPFYLRKIDFVILSHPHDDHILGLIEVIKRYEIGALIYMRQNEPPGILNYLLEVARQRNVNIIELQDTALMNFSKDCKLKIVNPEILEIKEDQNNSLISKINCRGLSALFTGDNSVVVEEALLTSSDDWSAAIFKAAHHGSKTANSEAFLLAVNPQWFVISAGILNSFGHPHLEVTGRVLEQDIKIKRTDKEGTIKIKAP